MAEQGLFDLATKGTYDGGFEAFNETLASALKMAEAAHKRAGPALRVCRPASAISTASSAACTLGPHHPRRPAQHGQDGAGDEHRLQRGA